MSVVNILDYPGLNDTNPQGMAVQLSTLLNVCTVIPWHIDQVANGLPCNLLSLINLQDIRGYAVSDGIELLQSKDNEYTLNAISMPSSAGGCLNLFKNTANIALLVVRATAYRKFVLRLSNLDKLSAIYAPTHFSKWETANLSQCSSLRRLVVTEGVSGGTSALNGITTFNELTLRTNHGFDVNFNDVPELTSIVLWYSKGSYNPSTPIQIDVGNEENNVMPANLQTCHLAGTYDKPNYGITGETGAFYNLTSLTSLKVNYTGITITAGLNWPSSVYTDFLPMPLSRLVCRPSDNDNE